MKYVWCVIFDLILVTSLPTPPTQIEDKNNKDNAHIECTSQPDNDVYRAHPLNCNAYYQCIQNTFVERFCPSELFWNQDESVCDSQQKVDCDNESKEIEVPEKLLSSKSSSSSSSSLSSSSCSSSSSPCSSEKDENEDEEEIIPTTTTTETTTTTDSNHSSMTTPNFATVALVQLILTYRKIYQLFIG